MRQASGIDHVGVTSSDLERSLAFYCDLLGMIVIDQGVEESTEIATLLGIDGVSFEFADLDSGDGRVFELLRYRRPEGTPGPVAQPFDPGTPHLAIRVADLDAVAARLAEAGVTMISRAPLAIDEPGTPWDGGRYLLTRDPDGVIVELVERSD
jgi:glyoxylase I family protein